MTKRTINAAIKHLGLEIQNNRDGYSYFTDAIGNQIGESVMVCYLNSLTVEQWLERARIAIEENNDGRCGVRSIHLPPEPAKKVFTLSGDFSKSNAVADALTELEAAGAALREYTDAGDYGSADYFAALKVKKAAIAAHDAALRKLRSVS